MQQSGYVRITRIFFILFLTLSIIGFGNSSFGSDYSYRTSIEIQENSGNDLKNYQANLSINTSKYIDENKMDPSCSDIRFEGSDGEKLDYWLDNSTCNTMDTRVFVKIPEISSYSTELIYMYHGNPEADTGSNPEATMTFYDDFSDGDTSGWNDYGDTGGSGGSYSHSISSESLYGDYSAYISGDANCGSSPYDGTDAWYDRSVDLNDTEYVLEFTAKAAGGTTDYSCGGGASPDFFKNNYGEYVGGAGVSCYDSSCSTCETEWGTGKHVINGSTTSSLSPVLRAGDCERSEERWFDRIIVRNHADPAPTYTVGEELETGFCNYRGPFNECILNQTKTFNPEVYDVSSVFEVRENAVLNSNNGIAKIKVENSSLLSGVWTGGFNISKPKEEKITIKPNADFRPNGKRIIIGN